MATPEGDDAERISVTLTGEGEAPYVRWFDSNEMRFRVDNELDLEPGVYDIIVENANGESTRGQTALGVVARPQISALNPSFLCLESGARIVEVRGDGFIVDGESPTIEVGGQTYTPTLEEDCRELAPIFGGATVCQSLTFELPQGAHMPGVEDVVVTNPAPAACSSDVDEDASRLRVVPPPVLDQITEELACVEQGSRSFTLSGSGFIATDAEGPAVRIAGQSYSAAVDGCETVDTFDDAFESCTTLSITVDEVDIPAGVHDVVVDNPSPAGCSSSEAVELTVTPAPTIDSATPRVLCSAQLTNEIVLEGSDFIVVDGVTPVLEVGSESFMTDASNCSDLSSVTRSSVESCETLTASIPAGTLDDGVQTLTVTNPDPAGCSSESSVTVTFTPPPTVTSIVEDFTCVETQTTTASIEGSGYLTVDGTEPTVTIGPDTFTVLDVSGCMSLAQTEGVETCTTIEVELPQGSLSADVHDVVVTNPAPAACQSEEPIELEVVPAPTVTAATPGLFCNDSGDTELAVTGTGFFVVDQTAPTVLIDGQVFASTGEPTACTATTRADVEACTELRVTIPETSLPSGPADIEVVNPEPVACTSPNSTEVQVAGPPNIMSSTPQSICSGAAFDGAVTLTGQGFFKVDGAEPTVVIDGTTVAATTQSCTNVHDANATIESCTELAFVVPVASRNGDVTIDVTNPAPADCGGASTFVLSLKTSPEIDTVTPLRICETGGSIQIDGQNFDPGMTVSLGFADATMVTVNAAGTQATAEFANGVPFGLSELRVENPDSCFAVHDEEVRSILGPQAFFVDPPVLYDGISTQVTIFLTGLFGGSVTDVELIDSMGNTTALSNVSFDSNRPNRVQAIVPAGTLDPGVDREAFGIRLTDDIDCSQDAADLVEIVSELTVSVEAIDPPFGWTQDNTAVSIFSAETPPAGEVQFEATPRVYLNPTTAGQGDIATEVESVEFISATELAGIVTAGLPADPVTGTTAYDVIVINPDGSIGLLPAGYESTTEPPPLIDTVSPGSWETNDANFAFVIEGSDFRMPTVEVTCLDTNGVETSVAATVTANTDSQIDATVNTNNFSHLSVCEIRVTNTDQGTYADFAPITVTNPAGNFVSFIEGLDLNETRRNHVMSSGTPTRTARFIYAMGGIDDTGTLIDSIEATGLNRFGRPTEWITLRSELPVALRGAGSTRIGDFIYVAGGHDGTEARDEVWRARVLDPLDSPDITNVEFDLDVEMVTPGIDPGVYYYSVSAVMEDTDTQNPGGETLASERQPVRIPFGGITLTLSWNTFPDAKEYRVFRSPVADAAAGEEELIAVVPVGTTSFVDDGTVATTGEAPLMLGELGAWHSVATLPTARSETSVVSAQDPVDADTWHLYAIGGNDDAGTVLSSTDYVSVTVDAASGDQTAGVATTATAALPTERAEHRAVVGTQNNASRLSGSVIYVLAGKTATTITRNVDYTTVAAGGDIASWTGTNNIQRQRAGYAAAVANNVVVTACGQNGAPSATADKQDISDTNPPELGTSSALGNTGDLGDRYLLGSVAFGGYLYVTGGETSAQTSTETTAFSILGGTP